MIKEKNNTDTEKKYKFKEAMDYLGVCERSLRYLVADDGIVYHRTGSEKRGILFFLKPDLDDHLYPKKGNKKHRRTNVPKT